MNETMNLLFLSIGIAFAQMGIFITFLLAAIYAAISIQRGHRGMTKQLLVLFSLTSAFLIIDAGVDLYMNLALLQYVAVPPRIVLFGFGILHFFIIITLFSYLIYFRFRLITFGKRRIRDAKRN